MKHKIPFSFLINSSFSFRLLWHLSTREKYTYTIDEALYDKSVMDSTFPSLQQLQHGCAGCNICG
jgi:hypothetical protein